MGFNFLKHNKLYKCAAVIVAAGSSTRAGSDKLFEELSGIPVLAYTISAFQKCKIISDIIIVTREDKIQCVSEICNKYSFDKVRKVVRGGESRTESAMKGISEVPKKTELIAIHDGARPFVSDDLINNCVAAAHKYHAAVPALTSTDTIKIIDNSKFFSGTLDREKVCRVQTPQVFDADLIKGALSSALQRKVTYTDDSAAVEYMGFKAAKVTGSEDNIKITYNRDFSIANIILSEGNYSL